MNNDILSEFKKWIKEVYIPKLNEEWTDPKLKIGSPEAAEIMYRDAAARTMPALIDAFLDYKFGKEGNLSDSRNSD